ncbi:hypothetical protein RHGRI_024758 [Rhododendron griersonianum]|uniref:Gnk2-homologous domain-containing protein n=1 Tax=Rhododendron griersonianum TaxID=479676 RepID=A0AAV6JFT6_9ERIC|nr:hypothetical protein RHGRI_024758 [Rhododendron griersonianum]
MNAAALTGGFYSFTAARDDAAAYGLLLCRGRGDLSLADCLDCIVFATQDVPKLCPGANSVTIWYDECMLRYSNVSIFATLDESCTRTSMTAQSVSETGFSYVLGEVTSSLQRRSRNLTLGNFRRKMGYVHYEYLQIPNRSLVEFTPQSLMTGN